MDDLKAELSLSDEQVNQLKALEVSNHAKMKAIRKDRSLDSASRQKQMDEIKKTAEERRKTILTPEQVKKMEAKKDQRKARPKKMKS